jgi:hypothetical protein
VLIVWLGSFLTGTFFNQLKQWVNAPSSAVNLIGTAVPLTAIFFMSYMVLQVMRVQGLQVHMVLLRTGSDGAQTGRLMR